jgi:DNA-binding response OmpR family regulator
MAQLNFLLVDDEPYLTTLVAQALTKRGDLATIANNGRDAMALATSQRFDLIVSDFQMPICNGLELATQLRQAPKTANIPVILLTARGHRITPTMQAATNIKWIVSKPFSMRELLTRIDEVFKESLAA